MVAYAPYISEQQHPGSGKFRDEWNGIAITQPWDALVREGHNSAWIEFMDLDSLTPFALRHIGEPLSIRLSA